MSDRFIPSPISLHKRHEFGHKENSIEELEFYRIVAVYLQDSLGDGYASLTFNGKETKEVAIISINTETFYEQSLAIAQYLWDIGYFVYFNNSRVPKPRVSRFGCVELYISWDTDFIKKRGLLCPCWACPMSIQEKIECLGCDKHTVFLSSFR